MTLISTIIRDAYRESNLIAISADPTVPEQEEALRLLNRFIGSLFGDELGEPLLSVPLGANNVEQSDVAPYYYQNVFEWHIPLNVRVVANLTSPQTLNLHPDPQDGSMVGVLDKSNNLATYPLTLRGNGRTIQNSLDLVINTNGYNRVWFYRADVGDWKQVNGLTATDESPFPERFDDLLVIGLAMRINPRHANAMDPQSLTAFQRIRSQFMAKYRQNIQMPSELALRRLTSDLRYWNWSGYSYPPGMFDKGVPIW